MAESQGSSRVAMTLERPPTAQIPKCPKLGGLDLAGDGAGEKLSGKQANEQ